MSKDLDLVRDLLIVFLQRQSLLKQKLVRFCVETKSVRDFVSAVLRYSEQVVLLKRLTRSANRCLRISSHRSTMFNNRRPFSDRKTLPVKNRSFRFGGESVRASNLEGSSFRVNKNLRFIFRSFLKADRAMCPRQS